MARRLRLLLGSAVLVGCARSAPDPAQPEKPTRLLQLAFSPGRCVAGANVVAASALVPGPGHVRYLEPTDGELRFAFVFSEDPALPLHVRWLPSRSGRSTPHCLGPRGIWSSRSTLRFAGPVRSGWSFNRRAKLAVPAWRQQRRRCCCRTRQGLQRSATPPGEVEVRAATKGADLEQIQLDAGLRRGPPAIAQTSLTP